MRKQGSQIEWTFQFHKRQTLYNKSLEPLLMFVGALFSIKFIKQLTFYSKIFKV